MNNEIKQMTVQEFKYWLSGVEEMQSDDWSPDKRQWDRIREKIDSIVSNTVVTQSPQRIESFAEQSPQEKFVERPVQYAPSGVGRVAAPPPSGALFGNADNPAFPVKTPNVDSSKGGYEPAFI
jgi:hypothetical protein